MHVLQTEYTSCRRGLGAGSGFQMRRASRGVTPDELAEIARLGNYRSPNFPASIPVADRAYPVALRYLPLQSGRRALIHSAYSGLDYSGRGGNFMAHALVFQDGPPAQLPTDYFDWAGWKSSLSSDEDTNDPPSELEALDLSQMSVPENGPNIIGSDQKALLTDLVSSLFFIQETGRKIVIRADATDGVSWIAAILQLLPFRHALKLSVSTYQFDATDCADINATVEGTRFSFNQTQRDIEFFIFEPRTGLRSRLPSTNADLSAAAQRYARTVSEWLFDEPNILAEYKRFAAGFLQDDVDRSLADGLSLFVQSRADTLVTDDQFSRLASFVKHFTRPGAWARSVELLRHLLKNFAGRPTTGSIKQVMEVIFCAKDTAGTKQLSEFGFDAWQELFLDTVGGGNASPAELDDYWRRLVSTFSNEIEPSRLLERDFVEELCRHYPEMAAHSFAIVARYLAIGLSTPTELATSPPFCALLEEAMKRADASDCLESLFSAIRDLDALAGAFAHLATKRNPVLAVSLLKLNAARPETNWQLRQRLYDMGAANLLRDEFETLMRGSSANDRFAQYARSAEKTVPHFWRECKAELLETYWRGLPPAGQVKQAGEWVQGSIPAYAARSLHVELLKKANEAIAIDLSDKSAALLAQRIAALATEYSVNLIPNRPQIREVLHRTLKVRRASDMIAVLQSSQDAIQYLSEPEYVFFVRQILDQPILFEMASTEITSVLRMIVAPKNGHVVSQIFSAKVVQLLAKRKTRQRVAAAVFAAVEVEVSTTPQFSVGLIDRLATDLARRHNREIEDIMRATRRIVLEGPGSARKTSENGIRQLQSLIAQRQNTSSNVLRNLLRRIGDRVMGRSK